jgi:hypothetical protein
LDTQVATPGDGETSKAQTAPSPSPDSTVQSPTIEPYTPEQLAELMKKDDRLTRTIQVFTARLMGKENELTQVLAILRCIVLEAGGQVKFNTTTFALMHKDDQLHLEAKGDDRILKYVAFKPNGIVLTDGDKNN